MDLVRLQETVLQRLVLLSGQLNALTFCWYGNFLEIKVFWERDFQ